MPDIEMNKPNAKGKTVMDYLPAAMQKLMGQRRPQEGQGEPVADGMAYGDGNGPIDKKAIQEAIQTLKDYKAGKANLESRIVEEERWWKLRHWDVIRGKNQSNDPKEVRPEPTSAWLFNSITNKHADLMDNFPEPNVLPRESQDQQDAETLSSILPVIFERNEYEETYSRASWYKLKHGVVAKGVFWNNELEDGMGDVDIRCIDLLNLFWEPGITDLQASRNLFVVDLRDNDLLEQEYPQLKGKLQGQVVDIKQYVYDDNVDVSKKTLLVDWYYKKKTPEGKTVLHYCKFAGGEVLFSSENDPNYEHGYYEHGKYPIEFDVLFPEEGTPVGFGYIAVMKSPQLYIDKLSQVILENSMMHAKPRFMAKKSNVVNEDEFLDWSKPIVHYEGDPDSIQPLQVQQVGGNVINMLQMKIDELKETSSNRDFSQGGTGAGVTAAAAISALQEAGNKTSRDMIFSGYRSYTQECYLAIELIRQFYDEQRSFRITGKNGRMEFVQFSNQNIKGQVIPPAYPGQEMEPGYTQATRVPVFDVVVKPQKRSSYTKLAQNELAKEMYNMGFFNPQLAEQTMTALELMDFDGKEKVKERVQQGQTLMNQMTAMQEQMNKMGLIIYQLTGNDVLGLAQGGGAAGPQVANAGAPDRANTMAQAQKRADTSNMTAYGERLAKRAKPNMETQT